MSRRGGRRSIVAQHQMLHGIEADCSAPDGVAHRSRDLIGRNTSISRRTCTNSRLPGLPIRPSEDAAAWRTTSGKRQPAKRRSLVQRVDLLFDQRQVVQWIEYEVFALIGARMTCDHLRAA